MFWKKKSTSNEPVVDPRDQKIKDLEFMVKALEDSMESWKQHYRKCLEKDVRTDLKRYFNQLAEERQDLLNDQIFWQATKDSYVLEKLKEIGR